MSSQPISLPQESSLATSLSPDTIHMMGFVPVAIAVFLPMMFCWRAIGLLFFKRRRSYELH